MRPRLLTAGALLLLTSAPVAAQGTASYTAAVYPLIPLRWERTAAHSLEDRLEAATLRVVTADSFVVAAAAVRDKNVQSVYVAIVNRSSRALAVVPDRIALDATEPEHAELPCVAPHVLQRRAKYQTRLGRLWNRAHTALKLEHSQASSTDDLADLNLRPQLVPPGGYVDGFVHFARDRDARTLLLRVPTRTQVVEIPLEPGR
ncbi:MAG: hypothetical protein ACOY71_14080 [Gemmatimonadota bacterium]